MKALRFERTGDLSYLQLVELPTPRAASDDVLVRVRAAGINRSDVSNVLGAHQYTTVPRVPGRDFAGVTDRGEAVWGSGAELGFRRDGTHAEYVLVPRAALAPKPRSISFEQAAACGVPYVTAWQTLELARAEEGAKVLVIGAGGGVGSATMQLARLRGAKAAGAVRARQGSGLEFAHADASIQDLTPEQLANSWDVIVDTTGRFLAASIAALARGGRVVVMVSPGQGTEPVPVRDLYRREASIVGVNSLLHSSVECGELLRRLAPHFESGALRAPERIQPHPLGTGAYAALKGGASGKFVFTFGD
ncbi:MAG: zinc-binding alcohol dehydrogenase family protein [Betaproteobacteria bacterium]|nr:zinc-binding alcohol dehydrogenase family protein [Betaproteobacteria bacterium]